MKDVTRAGVHMRSIRPWQLPGHWGWVMALGVVLIILGAIGAYMSFTAVLESVLAAGWFLIASGLLQSVHAFSRHPRRNFGLDLLTAVSYVILGALVVSNPALGAREAALLLSLFFVVSGIYRIVTASVVAIAGGPAVFVSGIVALFLGIHLWAAWPTAGFWLVGFYICIEIAVTGWSLIMRGLSERRPL